MPKVRWGVHPVLEPALEALGEDRAHAIEDVLGPPAALDTGRLADVGLLCCEHVRPRVRSDRARFDELVSLCRRERADPVRRPDAPWQRDLASAARDREHGRGPIVIAALAAELAWADLLRSAPGAGVEAVQLAAQAVERTARSLRSDEVALIAFVRALAAMVGSSRG